MVVRQVFKNFYAESITKRNPVWELECDCDNDELFSKIELLFQIEFVDLSNYHKLSEIIAEKVHFIFDEIIDLKRRCKIPTYKEKLALLQLNWGLCVSTRFNSHGEFIYCYDIFSKSIYDKVFQNGEQYDFNPDLIYGFLNSSNKYLSNSIDLIENWISQLYYYSKSFSGLNDWCEMLFDEVYYNLVDQGRSLLNYHPQLLSNLLSWCEVNQNNKRSIAIRDIIANNYYPLKWGEHPNIDSLKAPLGLQLLLCKNYKNDDKEELFTELIKFGKLNSLAKLQAVVAITFNEVNLIKYFDTLKDSIIEYNKELSKSSLTKIADVYEKARIFKILLNMPLSVASEIGRSDIILQILGSYYDIKNPISQEGVLLIFPNHYQKLVFSLNGETITDEKDTQKIIIDIVDAENEAFNLFRLLKGGIPQKIEISNKPEGFPNPKLSESYEKNLYKLYDFSKISKEMVNLKSMCQFDLNSFPLQALMIKSIGETLPINLSLAEKLPNQMTKKIIFWSGFSQTSEIEKTALEEIFDNAKVEFEVHNEINSNLKKFSSRIEELNPDIIWISSHGDYQHYEPNKSEIKLSENESIGIRDFELLVNNGSKRRLLFLNVCEGGVHSQTGEFKNLGFPNLLASRNQDVISHLWMAEPRFAYVFGIFFAIGLTALKMNFFESYKYSLSHVLNNKAEILNEFENHPFKLTDLKERINNNDGTEWGNLITVGSPVYHI